ncbi:hypothetical protein OCHUTO_0379 [Orientia chuto str. Dubai]|uniref:Outer membrane protein beta-barrel domain-containing protein n=1 Tax=Orientia chuto str. Dubai TaxID=1359168 RepID=A0A0F3MMF6_9RICK|nr:hypothetical protein [Candidatus Orientia mediorientalis]KJV56627.1 hypothetical protein OCHUTO_0379 [Orientia chuto str. Dubai]
MKTKKLILAVVLLVPCLSSAFASSDDVKRLRRLEILEQLEDLEKLEKLQRLQQQLRQEGSNVQSQLGQIRGSSYYVKLSLGIAASFSGEKFVSDHGPLDADAAAILRNITNNNNLDQKSRVTAFSIGMYCGSASRVELSAEFMKDMIFNCDMHLLSGRNRLIIRNVPIFAMAQQYVNASGIAFMCKGYLNFIDGQTVSCYLNGGVGAQGLFDSNETNYNIEYHPCVILGLGGSIHIQDWIHFDIDFDVHGVDISSSAGSQGYLHGYTVLSSLRLDF